MKVKLKRLEGTKWKDINLKELEGQSFASYMAKSEEVLFLAIFDGETLKAAISNSAERLEKYKEQALTMTVEQMIELIGTEVMPAFIIKELPDGGLIERIV